MKLPKPKGRQQEVVYLPPKGHTVVLGTAGSGKTCMAILRGTYLQSKHSDSEDKTLILTFNRMLVSFIQAYEETSLRNLTVRNYHRVARRFLSERNLLGSNSILDSKPRKQIVLDALENVKRNRSNPILNRNYIIFVEEIIWIECFGIKKLADYENVQRVGRKGTRINKTQRKYVWEVYQVYKKLRKEKGYQYDWDDIAITVQDELRKNNNDWKYRHIIIDEGQDFSPSMLRSMASAVPKNGSLTVFGDVAQQIYGTRVTWKDAGLIPPKVWNFKENYRNTKEIAELAIELTKSEFFKDETDIVLPNITKAAATKPTLLVFKIKNEYQWMERRAIELSKSQQLVFLVRKRSSVKRIISDLKNLDSEVKIKELHHDRGNYLPEQGIMVGTYHSAKGLEFETVMMPFLSDNYWPFPERVKEIGEEDTCVEDVRLLYVGITRAKSRLILSFTGNSTIMLPKKKALYTIRVL